MLHLRQQQGFTLHSAGRPGQVWIGVHIKRIDRRTLLRGITANGFDNVDLERRSAVHFVYNADLLGRNRAFAFCLGYVIVNKSAAHSGATFEIDDGAGRAGG
ncbi:hypothetical protein DSECCO2_651750 [anaerobic digester metagenome]